MTAAIELYKSCISLVEIITVLILASNYAVVLIHNMGLEVKIYKSVCQLKFKYANLKKKTYINAEHLNKLL